MQLARLEFCDKETQHKWFKRHFELAASFQLPMFLHMRAAAPDFISILKEHRWAANHSTAYSFISGNSSDSFGLAFHFAHSP